jgi:DUF1680 family protein
MEDGISINFFVPGSYQLKTPSGKKITVNQKTDYPVAGDIHFALEMSAPEEMTIRVRIPDWSKNSVLNVNGLKINNVIPGEYAEIKRKWLPGDKISLQVDMRGRVEIHGTDHKYAAIVRGPIVLARDTQLPNTNVGMVLSPVRDRDGNIQLMKVAVGQDNIWMQYEAFFIPESYTETGPKPTQIRLCDYASAGNGKEQSTFQVWMPQLYNPREH